MMEHINFLGLLQYMVLKMSIDVTHPIGSYYETSNSSFNPNESWGGEWVLEESGRVHVSAGSGYAIGAKGGEATHKLTATEIPSHTHGSKSLSGTADFRDHNGGDHNTILSAGGIMGVSYPAWSGTHSGMAKASMSTFKYNRLSVNASHEHASVGGNGAHNNMQPYIVVNRWHRIG